ncbi:MAG TPA: hypothetical protein VLM11_08290 [Streptosporangiaceae bacterium]|nr:hypothetical protein [Streptosporangiaceae bacterium]
MSRRHGRAALQLAGWAAVGLGAVTAALTVLTIGWFVLLATAGLAVVLVRRADRRLAGPGLLMGAGLMPLYIAYLNRGGPGTVCTTTRTGGSCAQEWSPWPWVAAGVCLVGAGIALGVFRRAR